MFHSFKRNKENENKSKKKFKRKKEKAPNEKQLSRCIAAFTRSKHLLLFVKLCKSYKTKNSAFLLTELLGSFSRFPVSIC